jgi:hypothetical protein
MSYYLNFLILMILTSVMEQKYYCCLLPNAMEQNNCDLGYWCSCLPVADYNFWLVAVALLVCTTWPAVLSYCVHCGYY